MMKPVAFGASSGNKIYDALTTINSSIQEQTGVLKAQTEAINRQTNFLHTLDNKLKHNLATVGAWAYASHDYVGRRGVPGAQKEVLDMMV